MIKLRTFLIAFSFALPIFATKAQEPGAPPCCNYPQLPKPTVPQPPVPTPLETLHVFKSCDLGSLTLSGSVRDNNLVGYTGPSKNYLTGSKTINCQRLGGDWIPVEARFNFSGPQNLTPSCMTDPNSDTYSLYGKVVFRAVTTSYSINTEQDMQLNLRSIPINGFKTLISAEMRSATLPQTNVDNIINSHIDPNSNISPYIYKAPYSSDLYVSDVYPKPLAPGYSNIKDISQLINNGGPLYGQGCYKPPIDRITIVGSLNAQYNGLHTVLSTPVDGVLENPARDTGISVDSDVATQAMSALSLLGSLPQIPSLAVSLPLPAYTILVTQPKLTTSGYSGTTTKRIPAIFNVPMVVPVIHGSQSDAYVVTLGEARPAVGIKNNEGKVYYLRIQRTKYTTYEAVYNQIADYDPVTEILGGSGLDSAICGALPVDIKAEISLSSPLDIASDISGQNNLLQNLNNNTQQASPKLIIGYDALSAGADNSPADYMLVLEQSAGRFALHQGSKPCFDNKSINLTANFTTSNGATDLTFVLKQPQQLVDLSIEYIKNKNNQNSNNKEQIIYRADKNASEFSIAGINSLNPVSLSLRQLPENIDYCLDPKGNNCSLAWRRDRQSQGSIKFSARNSQGSLSPVLLNYYSSEVVNDQELFQDLSLNFANMSIDYKLDFNKWAGLLIARYFGGPLTMPGLGSFHPSVTKNYPFWFFMNTQSQPFSGMYTAGFKAGSTVTNNLKITSSSTATFNRELYLAAKWYGPRLYRNGAASCGGFDIQSESLRGDIRDFVLGKFCNSNFNYAPSCTLGVMNCVK